MSNFHDKFLQLFEQDASPINIAPDDMSPDRAAMANTLDKGVTPEQYDVPAPRGNIDVEQKEQQLAELKEWISKIDNFIDFLNAPNEASMQSKLHAAHCKSLFESIAGSEKKKISRMAADLGSFNQTLKGYLIGANT